MSKTNYSYEKSRYHTLQFNCIANVNHVNDSKQFPLDIIKTPITCADFTRYAS